MRKIVSILVGLIVAAVTVSVFFLSGGEKSVNDWIAFGFILFAQIALFASIMLAVSATSNTGKTIILTGVATTLFLYMISTVILSFLTMLYVNTFLIIQIILFGIVAIICVLLIALSGLGGKDT